MKKQAQTQPLPFALYYVPVVLIALAGIGNTMYLAISHYRVYTDLGYKSFCAVSRSINCDTVSQSPYSVFLDIPVPLWGVLGYSIFLLLLLLARRGPENHARFWPLLFVLSLFFALYSVILALISMIYIRSYCMMCIVGYAVNFALLFYTWLIFRRFGAVSLVKGIGNDFRWVAGNKKCLAGLVASAGICVIVSMMLFIPHYWEMSAVAKGRSLPHGTTEDGHPWIGAENPELVIVEFTDYLCFQCKKMHFFLREFMAANPGKIRLVHRNFPMDHSFNPLVKEPFHVGAGKMALLSLYAAGKENFWEFSDKLFNVDTQKGQFNLRKMAQGTGLDANELISSIQDPVLRQKLNADLLDGLKLGLTGTPGYLIDGDVYVGSIPGHILDALID